MLLYNPANLFWEDILGWIMISLLLPILAPFLGLWIIKGFGFPNGVPGPIQLIKDGQLGWAAVSFCCSALYEIFVPGTGMVALTGLDYGLPISGAIFLLVASGMIAAVGTAFPVTYPKPAGISPWKHYEVLIKSVGLTALSALLYGLVH